MEKWEYLTVELERKVDGKGLAATKTWDAQSLSAQQNVYGQQGWELVCWLAPTEGEFAGSAATKQVLATFKRKVV